MCDVVTVLETHNKQPEDSLQQNRYIYLLCVLMTSHTADPGWDFSSKRCCTNLMTTTCQRLCPHPALLLWAAELPAPGAGGWAWICAPTPAGNAGRGLTAHTDQSTRRLVSPNQLLKHYIDDGGGSACTGSEYTKHPKAAGKATVAAKPCDGSQRVPAPH